MNELFCASLPTLKEFLTKPQTQKILKNIIDEKEDCVGPYSFATFSRPNLPRSDISTLRKEFHGAIAPFTDEFLDRRITTPVFVRDARAEDDFPIQAKAIYRPGFRSSALKPYGLIIIGHDFQGYRSEEVLSHEYAHHHQEECGFFTGLKTQSTLERFISHIFKEGHALGVEFAALRNLIPQKNPLIEFEQFNYLYPAAKIIEKMNATPDIDAFQMNSGPSLSLHEQAYYLGHALFAIAERKHGPGIYAEALRDPRVVLE